MRDRNTPKAKKLLSRFIEQYGIVWVFSALQGQK